MGKMPDPLRAAAAAPDVLLAAEGLPVRNRVTGLRIPGAKVGAGVRTAAGSIVILPDHILASVGQYVIADSPLRADGGRQDLVLTGDGMPIEFDVASVLASGSGTVQIYFRLPLDDELLGRLPATRCSLVLSHAAEALLNPWHGSYAAGSPRSGSASPPGSGTPP